MTPFAWTLLLYDDVSQDVASEPRGNNVPSSPLSTCGLQSFLFFHLFHLSIMYYFIFSVSLFFSNYVCLLLLASFSCYLFAGIISGHIYIQ